VTVAVAVPLSALASTPVERAGSAGTEVPLRTDSAVTVSGRGKFADLKITVGQTKSLVHQALSVTWKGGVPSNFGEIYNGKFHTNFLQIFQCWGDDDGTQSANPGPPPEQCEFGAAPLGDVTAKLPVDTSSDNSSRVIGSTAVDGPSLDRSQGFFEADPGDPRSGRLWKPFRAVDGTVVNAQTASVRDTLGTRVEWQNPFFDFVTTNEIRYGRTYAGGTGSELFEAETGEEARGLGCGQKVQSRPGGNPAIPRCWLVVVPRGGVEENLPLPTSTVVKSPLAPSVWANRVAVPLEFNPRDSPCAIGADERRIVGSELSTAAVTNWQPALCATSGAPPYAYAAESDGLARRQLLSGGPGAAGMAVISRPVDPTTVDPANPITYAPFTLSGVAIGFNIERRAKVEGVSPDVGSAQTPFAGSRVGHLNLTPRLVAKLLTESYAGQFYGPKPGGPEYAWLKNNPASPVGDPDFVQYNPEFQDLALSTVSTGGSLVVEAATSDAAALVWQWILADPEARAWLAGAPDAGGMAVNPRYSTDAARNPSGAAFAKPDLPDTFPSNDPFCYEDHDPANLRGDPPRPPRPLCMLDVHPYAGSMEAAAQETRVANTGAKTTHGDAASQQTPSTFYGSDGPQGQGSRSILSVTDTASAARFGLQAASLSRAGDDGATRRFVAPDPTGLLGGAEAMVASPVKGVAQPDPATTTAGAYPLTMLTYAAVPPAKLDAKARADYAAVVDFAADRGQKPGFSFGDLPLGYAPLPPQLRAQSVAAAKAIRAGVAPAPEPPTEPSPEPAAGARQPSTKSGSSGGGTGAGGDSGTSPSGADPGLPPADSPAAGPAPTAEPGAPVALTRAITRTAAAAVGFIRFTLPIAAGVGLLAALGAWLLTERRRRLGGTVAPPGGGGETKVPATKA